MKEIFKDVNGYNGLYKISNFGNVISYKKSKKGEYIKKYNNKGYLIAYLSNNKNSETIGIHRLVAIHFIPNPENKPQVNHKDFNKSNNHVNNLEWVTHQENIDHFQKYGTRKEYVPELIVWSELSRLLTGNRVSIRSNYSGKKYQKPVKLARRIDNILRKYIEKWLSGRFNDR